MEGNVYLRRADREDVELFFRWVNEPAVRENSFNTELIPWESHRKWFEKVLADDGVRIYVLMQDNLPVGQVRLVFEDSKWQISYSIMSAYRGQGYGKIILQLAENELIKDGHAGDNLFAEVKADNIASQRIFIRLGYREIACKRSDAHAYDKVVKSDLYNIEELVPTTGWAVLLLSNNANCLPLLNWLEKREKVTFYSGRLNVEMLQRIQPNLVISYNYRHIVKKNMIDAVHGRIINLHTSMLPWNRGASPNLWSIIDNTPKGVTIHVLDEGLDTGDILLQKELIVDEERETLRSSYELLNQEIMKLLQDNWKYIYHGEWHPKKQINGGSKHTMKDLQDFLQSKVLSYDMTIAEFKRNYITKEQTNATSM